MRAAAITVAIFVSCINSGTAFAYCSEPQAPSCATRYGAFDDQNDFEDCKRKMRFYADEVDSFSSCQADLARAAQQLAQDETTKAQRESEEAISEFNTAVQRFNRRAQGG